jgi:hypothetical protein
LPDSEPPTFTNSSGISEFDPSYGNSSTLRTPTTHNEYAGTSSYPLT